jgi:hypothetical protein
VVTLHTQRRGKQRWQGVWKSQYAKERISTWVCVSVFGMHTTSRSEQNKFTEDIAYAQERSQSQSQCAKIPKSNVCNLLVFRLPSHLLFVHILEQSATLRKSYYHQNRTTIISFGSHLLEFIRFVQSEFWFLRYFTDGDKHQQDYFIFLGLQVIHRDLQPIFLKGTVGIRSVYW